jgi:phosphoribosylformylglycinamidine (FGAM) synthase PurS component
MNIGIATHNIIKENVFTKIRKYTTIELFNITLTNNDNNNVANTIIKNIIHRKLTNPISQHTIINIIL